MKHSGLYDDFLRAKVALAPRCGLEGVSREDFNPLLRPHQVDCAAWLAAGGRRALFAAFGLGKTMIQLETVRVVRARVGGRGLIALPLGVLQEFRRDAETLEIKVRFVRTSAEVLSFDADDDVVYLTNFESVREQKIDPRLFSVASLDEASILRGFGGTKTFRRAMADFAGDDREAGLQHEGVPYRFVATATPSPNDFEELLAYAAFLGVMDVAQAKTRFFKRDSTKADRLTLHSHKADEFWQWVGSWALFLQRPSDLGHSDDGYTLPDLDVRWHELPTDHTKALPERDGQGRLFRNAALNLQAAAKEKRDSLPARVGKIAELLGEHPDRHVVIWHDLEAERGAIQKAVPSAVSVWGTQDLEERERRIVGFSDGEFQILSTKPTIAGSGCNFQRHCSWAIFAGIGFKFQDFIQAIHRLHRFLQTDRVRIDVIYTEAERQIRAALERKWQQHAAIVQRMSGLIRRHGLAHSAKDASRTMDVDRHVVEGDRYRLVCGDAVDETRLIPADSVDLVVTSIPFSTQYEYSPSYRDLGHTDDDDHFFEHLGFVTEQLYRILKPGRVLAVHVKDRIVPGGVSGHGFQTVNRLSDKAAAHLEGRGFAFLARKTVVTDVVRENNQTYRLGWTEQCKDGSRMGAGLPEYLLILRKPPTDGSNGYADQPVVKSKTEYSLARWQVDAHGYMRSSGDRHLAPEELCDLPHDQVFKAFKEWGLAEIYDFERHVAVGEAMAAAGRLPTTFMLLQPASWHPDVWADVVRMRTLNTLQAHKGKEQHLCPMPIDIVERLITQYSMKGDLVFDPFGGLMTVPYCALRLGRRGTAIELNPVYYADGVAHVEAAARAHGTPTLFDLEQAA